MISRRYVILSLIVLGLTITNLADESLSQSSPTDLSQEWDDPLLMLSTLDGSFIGIGQKTGFVRWTLKDEPVVKVPVDTSKAIIPLFLPDPKDGSLYILGSSERETLKKLPLTIPQLVASSPCRSNDGILYTGKKVDTWFSVDPKSGIKEQVLSFDKVDKTCPISNVDAVFIGRTEYNLMMLDSKRKERRWNVTFFDYSSKTMDTEAFKNYELLHFTASSTGRIVTLNRRQGTLLWEQNYGSPITAVYVLENEGLVALPFTSVAEETLDHLVEHFNTSPTPIIGTEDIKLFPTLYIGEHRHGLYAFPSLVDENTVTISPTHAGPLLLEGPPEHTLVAEDIPLYQKASSIPLPGDNVKLLPNYADMPITFQSLAKDTYTGTHPLLILGHYKVPDYSKTVLQITGRTQVITKPSQTNFIIFDENGINETTASERPESVLRITRWSNVNEGNRKNVEKETEENAEQTLWEKLKKGNVTYSFAYDFLTFACTLGKTWISQQENEVVKFLPVVVLCAIFTMLWYLHRQLREFQQLSHGSIGSNYSHSSNHVPITALPEDIGGGVVRVGKITFNTEEVLGKGCEGTFVYKGTFDNRAVAVKRILPECFTFADREVDLLRESDEHPHVIRYFCMEQDKQFRYIALELCAATLQDYVEGYYDKSKISVLEILYQATLGLEHLHALDIVHRDIKPHNVLISMENAKGEVRVMISDFGLCKKLKVGRISFSRRSGITGTDGWIAPEMLNGTTRTTCSVDVFSLGCVFYYVLSNGKHPFGDALRRQANIISGESRLLELEGDDKAVQYTLIDVMISPEAFERPPASAIQRHPIFWNNARILCFFMDVSDRIEKEDQSSIVLQTLESNCINVVRDDWRNHIDAEVVQDLRKYRNYSGNSIRDLLRALRNKKHHYRELSVDVQKSLGEMPNKFIEYWMSRFPLLLLHTWIAMHCVKHEPIFSHYYHKEYDFSHHLQWGNICSSINHYNNSLLTTQVGNDHCISHVQKSPQNAPKMTTENEFSPKRRRYLKNGSTGKFPIQSKEVTHNWRKPNNLTRKDLVNNQEGQATMLPFSTHNIPPRTLQLDSNKSEVFLTDSETEENLFFQKHVGHSFRKEHREIAKGIISQEIPDYTACVENVITNRCSQYILQKSGIISVNNGTVGSCDTEKKSTSESERLEERDFERQEIAQKPMVSPSGRSGWREQRNRKGRKQLKQKNNEPALEWTLDSF